MICKVFVSFIQIGCHWVWLRSTSEFIRPPLVTGYGWVRPGWRWPALCAGNLPPRGLSHNRLWQRHPKPTGGDLTRPNYKNHFPTNNIVQYWNIYLEIVQNLSSLSIKIDMPHSIYSIQTSISLESFHLTQSMLMCVFVSPRFMALAQRTGLEKS